jgi:transglutaminase-like putative cysteine protease
MRPESASWNGYLEDTITIDWQTPAIVERAKTLAGSQTSDEAKARACYELVRDEIPHTADAGGDALPCRASEVLAARTGIGFAKSHLLAALLRSLGIPAGFSYQVLRRAPDSAERLLYGFNGVYLASRARWIALDARGNKPGLDAQFAIDPPRLALTADPRAASGCTRGSGRAPLRSWSTCCRATRAWPGSRTTSRKSCRG